MDAINYVQYVCMSPKWGMNDFYADQWGEWNKNCDTYDKLQGWIVCAISKLLLHSVLLTPISLAYVI